MSWLFKILLLFETKMRLKSLAFLYANDKELFLKIFEVQPVNYFLNTEHYIYFRYKRHVDVFHSTFK